VPKRHARRGSEDGPARHQPHRRTLSRDRGALWRLEDSRARTISALAGVDADWHLRSGPDGANTLASLLYHIAAIELDYAFVEVRQEDFPPEAWALFPRDVRDEHGRLAVIDGSLAGRNQERLDWTRQLLLASFRDMTLDRYRAGRVIGDRVVSPEWVLHHLTQHEAEHRGEIQVLIAGFER
jgi:uncharacterized damage-inducible protein DinB